MYRLQVGYDLLQAWHSECEPLKASFMNIDARMLYVGQAAIMFMQQL